MATAILPKFSSVLTATITLASLASSTTGVGRQCTLFDNTTNRFERAKLYVSITVGTTPTINSVITIYLICSDKNTTAIRDDAAGASDAALTVKNCPVIGVINVPATTSNVTYVKSFDVPADLGPEWGIAVVNSSGVALNSTGGNHNITVVGVYPEAQ